MEYSIWQNIKYLSNFNKTIVHLQCDIDNIPEPKDISPLFIREMDIEDDGDIQSWIDIVNEAYNESPYDVKAARNQLKNHLFLNIDAVYFIMDKTEPIGTISIGTYKENKNMGGDARIAIKKNIKDMD